MNTYLPFTIELVDNDGYHLFTNILVNNKLARMVIDTGASKTVFDIELMKDYIDNFDDKFNESDKLSAGLGGNSIKSYEINVDSLKLNKLLINNYHSCLLDLQHVNNTYEQLDMPKVLGVIGSDIFVKYNANISFVSKKIKFEIK